jgi:hypothetical protein
MLTQEEYMDVLKLHRQSFTIAEIADELGYHPATISRWIKDGGPPPARESDRSEALVIGHPYEQLKDDLGYLGLEAAAECFATSSRVPSDLRVDPRLRPSTRRQRAHAQGCRSTASTSEQRSQRLEMPKRR